MWHYGPWGWFPFMWIFPLLCLLLFVFLLTRRRSWWPERGGASGPSAREILDRRYARGEITREEYRRLRSDIESASTPA
jgi:putative membrane protein